MDDETLARLYREATRTPKDASRPTPEMLQRAVAHEGTEEERLATFNAALGSAEGQRELALLASVAAAARAAGRKRLGVLQGLAAAASIAVVATAGLLWWSSRAAPEPFRGSAGAVELVGVMSTGDAALLIWHAMPAARRYLVEVLDSSGRVVQETRTSDTTAMIPAALASRTGLRWWVQAETDSGTRASAIMKLE